MKNRRSWRGIISSKRSGWCKRSEGCRRIRGNDRDGRWAWEQIEGTGGNRDE